MQLSIVGRLPERLFSMDEKEFGTSAILLQSPLFQILDISIKQGLTWRIRKEQWQINLNCRTQGEEQKVENLRTANEG
jgi:hypothetical protein